MSYSVIPIDRFKREAKRLIKKYPSLKSELSDLTSILSKDPTTGKSLGNNTFKIRLAIKSKGKGKSGGLRVITHLGTEIIGITMEEGETTIVTLISIYNKSETAAITDKELKDLIARLENE